MKCIKPVKNFAREYYFFTDFLMFAAVCNGEKDIFRFKHDYIAVEADNYKAGMKKGKLARKQSV
jgi:hypothetical protein